MIEQKPITAGAMEGELLRLFVENIKDYAIFVTDPEGRVRSWNPGAERLLGYSESEIIGQSASLFSTPENNDEQVAQREMDKAVETGRGEDERWHVRKDGSRFWSVGTITPLWDEGRNLRGFAQIMRDRTSQKNSDAALKEALGSAERAVDGHWEIETRFTLLVKNIKDHAIFTMDLDGRITSWNVAAERILGYCEAEVLGQPFSLIFVPEDLQNDIPGQELRQAKETGRGEDERWHARKGGERFWASCVVTPTHDARGKQTGFSKILRDMTQEKQAEKELQGSHDEAEAQVRERTSELRAANEELQREIAQRRRTEEALRERAVQATLNADVALAFTGSGSLREMLQLCAESMVRTLGAAFARIWTLDKVCNTLDLQASAGMYTHIDGPHSRVPVGKFKIGLIAEEKKPHLTNDVAHDPRIGDPEWANREGMEAFAGYPLVLENRLVGVMAMFARQKLTETTLQALASVANQIALGIERKEQEETLQNSEVRYRQIVETANEGIWTIDDQGQTTFVNRALAQMLGYTIEEMTGRPLFSLLHERDHTTVVDNMAQLRKGIPAQFDMTLHRRDGREVATMVSTNPFLDRNGRYTGALAMVTDVTERKHLEEQFHQSQKMEAFGQLAGGVAHDFNNLLTIISGYSDIILSTAKANDPIRDFVKNISEAGERAASLTRQLLAFSRKTVLEPKVLDLNEVIRETGKMLRRLIGEDILLTTVLDPTISRVKVDPDQLGQVLMNLVVNARDAMPTGGNLTVESKNVELDEGYARLNSGVVPGKYVLLSVADSGSGMTEEVKARLFEPFFTTKGVGKGTGLGLAVVMGILKQSGGHVSVYSELNRGTTFKLYFPAVDEQAGAAKGLSHFGDVRGTETVLLVEDEDGVRALALLVLQMKGYKVLEASDGKAAMRVVAKHQGPIHLLVTDVVMPGMGGREVAEALQPGFPQMKVLYTSGYTDDAVVRHGILQAESSFLQKPYSPQALAKKVRQVLENK